MKPRENTHEYSLSNDGVVSQNRRKQYRYSVPTEVFDFIEMTAQEVLAQQQALLE